MFHPSSRYYDLETAQLTVADAAGNRLTVAYKRRRFIPRAENAVAFVEHSFVEGERLDLVTAAYLDDPTQFWRICDANTILHPAELEQVGRTLIISAPTR
jgi:hypothetical protein